MFPETPAQVDAFESRHRKKVKLPELLADPIAMLRRGFILQQADTTEIPNENTEGQSMAARNGLNLSADTLRKMDEDRQKAENQE